MFFVLYPVVHTQLSRTGTNWKVGRSKGVPI
jgi:hypothetical protein